MYKIFIAIVSLLIVSQPAFALPGDNYNFLSNWVKKHSFLSSEPDSYGDAEGIMEACRDTIEGKRVCWGANFENTATSLKESVSLSNDISNTNLASIWDRENDSAYKVLSTVYNSTIADDFKNSKFIHKTDHWVFTNSAYSNWYMKQVGYCCTKEIFIPKRFVTKDVAKSDFFNRGTEKFYVGEKFGYQSTKDDLIIMKKKTMWETIDILNNHKEVYDLYMKKYGPSNLSF